MDGSEKGSARLLLASSVATSFALERGLGGGGRERTDPLCPTLTHEVHGQERAWGFFGPYFATNVKSIHLAVTAILSRVESAQAPFKMNPQSPSI